MKREKVESSEAIFLVCGPMPAAIGPSREQLLAAEPLTLAWPERVALHWNRRACMEEAHWRWLRPPLSSSPKIQNLT